MTLNEKLTIAIPSIISILGFAVNIWLTKKEIKSVRDNKIFDEKILLYYDFIEDVEKINSNWHRAFETDYYEKLNKFRPGFKLVASKKVVENYKTLLEKIYNLQKDYKIFLKKNDPEEDPENYQYHHLDDGEYEEECMVTSFQRQKFEQEIFEYKQSKYTSVQEILTIIKNLWNDMRSDIGNEEIVY